MRDAALSHQPKQDAACSGEWGTVDVKLTSPSHGAEGTPCQSAEVMKRKVSAPNTCLEYCTAGVKCWFEHDCLEVQQDTGLCQDCLTNHLIHAQGSCAMAVEPPRLWCGLA